MFGAASGPEKTPSVGATFNRVIEDFLSSTSRDEGRVDQAIQDVALGKSTDFHSVALTIAKADLHFRLGMEIRNKLTDAYQEVMRMQV
jgi:flagellar hook-basal body complex protein FliE